MKRALATYPPAPFTAPDGVETARIDPTTGKRAGDSCPEVRTEVFLVGSEPELCTLHANVVDRVHRWWDRVWDWFKR
jgi:membrane carboxypeptidase/penicillin-binding protein